MQSSKIQRVSTQRKKTQMMSLESEPRLPRLVNVVVGFIYFACFMHVLLAKDRDWVVINL